MNLLVIGNGFDLAHGLPTSYKDFLRFVADGDMCAKFQKIGIDPKDSAVFAGEMKQLIQDNFWIDHFQKVSNCGENWIDFESEISRIIRTLDALRLEILRYTENAYRIEIVDFYVELNNRFSESLKGIFSDKVIQDDEYLNRQKEKLLDDLNRLTRCLEIYLSVYVNSIIPETRLSMINDLGITHVLSFNYTNTFERLYGKDEMKFHYIHGRAECNRSIENCNMILGIDEYLPRGVMDIDNEYIEFKKFYQRIFKGTGIEYKKWLGFGIDLRTKMPKAHFENDNIYIIGHSLDVTDKEVLKELLCHPHANVYIVYHDRKSMGAKISNMVKVVGEDMLIDKTYSANPAIHFMEQK